MNNLLEIIKEKIKDARYLPIAAGISGLIIGLFFAWVVAPVRWVDTTAETMRPDLRQDYLRMVITNYNLTYDQNKALQLFEELGENKETTLAEVIANPGFLQPTQINAFSKAVSTILSPMVTDTVQAEDKPSSEQSGKPKGTLILGLVLLSLLIIGAGLVYFFKFRNKTKPESGNGVNLPFSGSQLRPTFTNQNRGSPPAQVRPAAVPQAVPVSPHPAVPTSVSQTERSSMKQAGLSEKPVAQFMTTYMFGDDLYDESFTFDAPNGEFLGECGVSISDIIGVGEPKKISAFEVWLFDKNDVQTVTKVLMSSHIFENHDARQRLELKGEPILSEFGKAVELETASLRLEARIVDMAYGGMSLPDNSYFQRFTVELAVYRK